MLFLFLFLFGLALGTESPSSDRPLMLHRGNCPPFWFSFKGRCYKYVATRVTWADAELYCLSEKANLVSMHSLEEQNFVKSLIKNFDHTEGITWIGLNDVHKEGRWMWSNGCAVDFVFWNSKQPDNALGNEHCVHAKSYTENRLNWNDLQCSLTYPSVCASRILCQ
ncbi:lactose-binding lectin l-2-like [Scomber scombrus]|uniref:Lactose-binding lectin l-2-like n=1 Tax=Scomber scombrus TaxID=13677 RepID=A0AAV1PEZ1_SCOSC